MTQGYGQYILRGFFPIFLGLFLLLPEISAKHIVGGDMIYECIGNNTYIITTKMYRDCNSVNSADYDNPGWFGVYEGNTYLTTYNVPFTNRTTIPIDSDPCFEISDPPCVEEATYTFQVTLPQSNLPYTISYQRCCRNETITNIVTPGDVGATFLIEISPESQQSCNNSPEFNEFPPIVICAGVDINFDHSAFDPEGDSLVYSFCPPLIGGGVDGGPDNPTGNPNGPTGVQPQPQPGTAPPYSSVSYLAPTYTAFLPMAGDPPVTIDPETGLISGIPTTQGQFVVGVCVREFRDGVEIGEIRRDFQFNVISCTPLVIADIEADIITGPQQYEINACGDFTVDFNNQSIQESNIFQYDWFFDLQNGTDFVSNDRDVSITFPGLGTYDGVMSLNPGTPCADTAFITVNVFPDIDADFEFEYDTCVAGPVTFTDLSTTGSGQMDTWAWQFGDGNTSDQPSPEHTYQIPGDLPVTLTVTDINGCTESVTQNVGYFPAPAFLIVEPSIFEGCAPQEVFYNNLSVPIDSTYNIEWDFGDGNTSGDISPTHVYTEPGSYTINLEVTSPIGCSVGANFPNFVTVRPSPTAGFTFTPEQLTNFNMTAVFTDESMDAEAWLWDFGDGSPPVLTPSPTHTYQDTGFYEIIQVVRHPSGCLDTARALIEVEPLVTYHLPNAFTPNSDGKNEEFKGTGYFEGMTNFEMTIWNRWGELIFQTNDPEEAWNGRKNNQGDMLQNGVYVVLVGYTDPRGNPVRIKGFATLVR